MSRTIEYGRPDPLGRRLSRSLPRISFRCFLLLGTFVVLLGLFADAFPAWQEEQIAASQPRFFTSDEQAIAILPGNQPLVRDAGTGIEMLDIPTGKGLFASSSESIRNVLSKGGRRLLSCDSSSVLRLFDLATFGRIMELQLAREGYGQHEAAISDDGTRLIAWTPDGAELWDAGDGKKITNLRQADPQAAQIDDVTITSDQQLAVVWHFNDVDFFHLANGLPDHRCKLPGGFAQAVSGDGSIIAAAGAFDGNLHVMNGSGRDLMPPIAVGTRVCQVVISGDGRRVLSNGDGRLTLVKIASRTSVQSTPIPWGKTALSYHFTLSPDGHWLAIPGSAFAPIILVFDAKTLTQVASISGSFDQNGGPFSPDGQRFISKEARTKDLTVWSTSSWKPISHVHWTSNPDFTWYLNNGTILTGGFEGDLSLWTRHRPEAWYGTAVLPTFWLTLVSVVLTTRCMARDLSRWYHPAPEPGS